MSPLAESVRGRELLVLHMVANIVGTTKPGEEPRVNESSEVVVGQLLTQSQRPRNLRLSHAGSVVYQTKNRPA